MLHRLLLSLSATFLVASLLTAAETPAAPAQSYALLIGGMGGKEPYVNWYPDWVSRFQKYLTKSAALPAANVISLSGDAATTEAVLGAIDQLGKRIKPQDQFILFMVGHGEIAPPAPTLILPGPDLSAPQLAAALKKIASQNQIILNFSASSGDFLKPLASPARINLTATSPSEVEEPVFAEFFLRGLESKRAGVDANGGITLLKAYNWAAQQTSLWIARWTQTGGKEEGTQKWKANGRETIEIFEKLYPNNAMRKLDPASNRSVEDAPVELLPANGEVTSEWIMRRVIDEHAMLEDTGKETGVSVFGEKGNYQPILGEKPKDTGYVAGHAVLGKPRNP